MEYTVEVLKGILDKHKKWLASNGFEGCIVSKTLGDRYYISKNGEIASIYDAYGIRDFPMLLKPRYSTNGYRMFALKKKNYLAHRIVAECFLGDVSNKIVHHLDGNKLNNKIDNLKITDYSENNKHGKLKRKNTVIEIIETLKQIK